MKTKFYLFGPPRIEQAGELLLLRLQKALALFAYLAVGGQPHTREALATMLWPDHDASAGRGRLRRTLYELKGALASDLLLVSSDMIGLDPQAELWIDVAAFREIVAQCVAGDTSPAPLSDERVERLQEAVALYTGDFLGGFTLPDAPEFEDWRFFLAEELKRSLAKVLVHLANAFAARQAWEQAIPFARRRLALDPLHEPAHRMLMRLFASANHVAAAVRQYEQAVEILQEELGAEPEEETTLLYEEIRTRRFRPEPARAPAAPQAKGYARHEKLFAGGHAEVFCGEDLSSGETVAIKRLNANMVSSDPELVARFIREGRPVGALLGEPAAATDGRAPGKGRPAPPLPHRLPARATPFIGRDKELAAIASFLADPQARLLTILAPGGMGKTRLALAGARQLLAESPPPAAFEDGLYFVSLAPVDRSEKIAQAIAGAVGLTFEANAPASRTPERQLLDFLAQRHLLLILDNFEHLPEGMPFVGDILHAARGVKIVATSRERLNLQEEHLLALRGLDYPAQAGADMTPQAIGEYPAVRLFAQSACRIRPDFTLSEENAATVAEICRLVEGMPLAVELTAAWLDVLPVDEIAREVQRNLDFLETDKRDVPQRQRSIRAVFETTWQRLDKGAQEAFARLSVFCGGFDRVAAVEIADITLRMLRHLAGKSLLQYEAISDRYQMHELLRQYGALKLEELGHAAEVLDRHSAYFSAALQRYQEQIEGKHKRSALAAIERDVDNVFAAWEWAMAHGQVERLNQSMHSLEHFFYWRSRFHEAEAFYGKAAQLVASMAPTSRAAETAHRCMVAALQARHANFSYLLQNWDAAKRQFQDSLQTYEELEKKLDCDVRQEKAYILMKMADVTDDLQEARAQFRQSLELFEAVGHRWWTAGLRCHLGYVALASRQYDEARVWFEESLALYRELGDRWQFGWVMDGLSNVALYQRRLDEAEKLAHESLALHREIGLRDRIADNLTTLSWIALARGRQEESNQFREEAIAIWQALGLADRINIPAGLEDQPFTPRWFSDIIDQRISAVSRQAEEEEGADVERGAA